MTSTNLTPAAFGESSGSPYDDAVRQAVQFWDDRASGASRRILVGAMLAFAELGYHGASTREIANRSGMSPAAVYIHFESKQALFHRIAIDGHRASTGAFSDPARQGRDPLTQLRLGVASFAAWNAEYNIVSRSIEYEIRLHRGPDFADVWQLRRGVEQHLLEILHRGISNGSFGVSDPEWAKITILSTAIDVARWYRRGSPYTPTTVGMQYADLALTIAGAR